MFRNICCNGLCIDYPAIGTLNLSLPVGFGRLKWGRVLRDWQPDGEDTALSQGAVHSDLTWTAGVEDHSQEQNTMHKSGGKNVTERTKAQSECL